MNADQALKFDHLISVYVPRRVGIVLHKVGILTLPGEVRIPTLPGSIPELSLRKVGIGELFLLCYG